MEKTVFLDTGPLVAILDKRDQYHVWATGELTNVDEKLITCESVISETFFLTRNYQNTIRTISGMINEGLLFVDDSFNKNCELIFNLMLKYSDRKISLADFHLLGLYSESDNATIFTTDSDFLVYRDGDGNPLNLITPYKS